MLCHCLVIEHKRFHLVYAKTKLFPLPIGTMLANHFPALQDNTRHDQYLQPPYLFSTVMNTVKKSHATVPLIKGTKQGK